MNEKAFKKLSQIKIVVSDVDGILTDGTISVSKNQEFKTTLKSNEEITKESQNNVNGKGEELSKQNTTTES